MAATRKLLVAINLLFFLCGGAIAAMGGLSISGSNMGFSVVDKNLGIALLVVGGFIVVLAFLGLCGVCFRSSCILQLYFCLMCVVVAGEVFIVVFSITQRAQMEHLLSKGWNNAGQGMRNDFQKKEHCCGFESPTSPASTVCAACPDLKTCKLPGCKSALEDDVKKNLLIIEIVGGFVVLLQIVCLMLACCAIRSKRKAQRAKWEHGRPLLGPDRSINATDGDYPRPVVSSDSTHGGAPIVHTYAPGPVTSTEPRASAAQAWKPKTTAELIAEIRQEKAAESSLAYKDSAPDF